MSYSNTATGINHMKPISIMGRECVFIFMTNIAYCAIFFFHMFLGCLERLLIPLGKVFSSRNMLIWAYFN